MDQPEFYGTLIIIICSKYEETHIGFPPNDQELSHWALICHEILNTSFLCERNPRIRWKIYPMFEERHLEFAFVGSGSNPIAETMNGIWVGL